MRLPFFRSNRRETEPAPSSEPPSASGETSGETEGPKPSSGSRTVSHAPAAAERTVPFPVDIVVENIPERLRGTEPLSEGSVAVIDLPGLEVLSQVSRGEVVFSLRSLLPLLPDGCLKKPLPKPLTDFVRLPLHEVVSRIPTDWLELRADQEILTPPGDLPDLFGEASSTSAAVEAPGSIEPSAAAASADLDRRGGPGPAVPEAIEDVPRAVGPPREALPARPPAPAVEIEGNVRIRLARLLDALPSGVLATDATGAIEGAELEFPLADILPQLARGEIVVSLRDVVNALPSDLRGEDARDIPVQPVPLPLDVVVGQVPSSCFAMSSDQVVIGLPGEHEIPVPFMEAAALPDAVEARPAEESAAPTAEQVPVEAEEMAAAFAVAPAEDDVGETGVAAPGRIAVVEPATEAPAEIEPSSIEPSAPLAAPTPVVPDLPPAPLDMSAWPKKESAAGLGRSIDGLDINRCGEGDLLDLPGIGPWLAERIMRYREERGPMRSLYQLLDVPGIGPRLFERITGLSATETGAPVQADLGRLLGLPPNRPARLREIGAACERLPGVDAAAFASRDGLVITGRVGEGLDLDRVAACAPMLLRRISRYTRQVGWGKVKAFSVLADPKSLTVFATRQLMLLVAHEPGALSAETIERLGNVAEAAERSCSRRLILEDRRPWQ